MRLRSSTDGDIEQIGGGEPFLWDVGAEVTAETAWVVDCDVHGEIGNALHARRDGTDVCLHADSLLV